MFTMPARRRTRRPSLTPMIDVVFLLLVFFMLASRFGADFAVPVQLAGSGGGYSGPPRVIDILPEGQRLNGIEMPRDTLLAALTELMETPQDALILRARDGAALQNVVDMMTTLQAAGLSTIVLVE